MNNNIKLKKKNKNKKKRASVKPSKSFTKIHDKQLDKKKMQPIIRFGN